MTTVLKRAARVAFALMPCVGLVFLGVAGAEPPKAPPPAMDSSKPEILPLDPLGKKGPREDIKIEYVEQKGVDANASLSNFGKHAPEARNISEMCEQYEGKIISFAGSTSLVEKCRQRVIEDSQVLNDLAIEKKVPVVDVTAKVVRTIPFGAPFEEKDVRKGSYDKAKVCKKMDGRYVTTDGDSFYFVEKCARRLFLSFEDFVSHNADNRPVLASTPEEIKALAAGPDMRVKKNEDSNILYKVDGDIYWSRLFPEGKVDRTGEDSLKKYQRMDEERSGLSKRAALCSRYEGKLVSFYSRLFLIEKCLRRPLLNVSLDTQTALLDGFGPQDISAEQYRAIPEGEGLDAEAFVKKTHSKATSK